MAVQKDDEGQKRVGLSELLETAIDLDVKLLACKMSMDVMEISREDLIDEVSIVGVAAYIKEASESGITLFINGKCRQSPSFPRNPASPGPGRYLLRFIGT